MDKYLKAAILFLREYTGDDIRDIDEQSHLIADLGLNSLQLIEIVNDAEMHFDIQISDDELENILVVGDIAKLLSAKNARVDD